LAQNFQPERTIYFVFGHDEEVSGTKGALPISQLMEKRGIRAEFVMDEGGMVMRKAPGGIQKPVALMATAEKGYLSIELSVEMPGGHSSIPADETALDVLTRAVVRLRQSPMPQRSTQPMRDFMDNIGAEMSFGKKFFFANRWLTEPLLIRLMSKDPKIAAMFRSTVVPTVFSSGIKDNVIPSIAKATINFRILPGDSSTTVLAHARKAIDDERVKFSTIGIVTEPSGISNVQSFGFRKIAQMAQQNFDGALVIPFLMVGGTDSKYFEKISDNIIKFSPMIDPIGFHAVNERVSVDSYQRALSFYDNLLRSLQ
jgi:carboxypeptidase PM20D1